MKGAVDMQFLVDRSADGKLMRNFLRECGVSATLLAKLKRREDGILQNGMPVTVRAVLRAAYRASAFSASLICPMKAPLKSIPQRSARSLYFTLSPKLGVISLCRTKFLRIASS
jgi:hypothetical protein